MSDDAYREPMLEMFIFETAQLIEQLEEEVLNNEKATGFSTESINKIFRIMHTIKSSAAMMLFKNISALAHAAEDLFFFIREEKLERFDHSRLTDIILLCIDYIKNELDEIQSGKRQDSDASELINAVKLYLTELKGGPRKELAEQKNIALPKFYIPAEKQPTAELRYYRAVIFFEEGCEMENVRAFTIVHHLKELAGEITYTPADIIANTNSAEIIQKNGFTLYFLAPAHRRKYAAFWRKQPFWQSLI